MIAEITNRTCLYVFGEDTKTFLQGLITNDMNLLDNKPAIYACFLTPQGKFLYDFMVTKYKDGYVLEVLKNDLEGFQKRLKVYALRAKVKFDVLDLKIYAIWEDQPPKGAYLDPRLDQLGHRLLSEKIIETNAGLDDYDLHRAKLTVPDGSRDLKPELSTIYDGNLDMLNAVSLKKGCFLGQELTARVHYRGLVKKRLYTLKLDQPTDDKDIRTEEGALAGETLSSYQSYDLALIKTTLVDDLTNVMKPEYL